MHSLCAGSSRPAWQMRTSIEAGPPTHIRSPIFTTHLRNLPAPYRYYYCLLAERCSNMLNLAKRSHAFAFH